MSRNIKRRDSNETSSGNFLSWDESEALSRTKPKSKGGYPGLKPLTAPPMSAEELQKQRGVEMKRRAKNKSRNMDSAFMSTVLTHVEPVKSSRAVTDLRELESDLGNSLSLSDSHLPNERPKSPKKQVMNVNKKYIKSESHNIINGERREHSTLTKTQISNLDAPKVETLGRNNYRKQFHSSNLAHIFGAGEASSSPKLYPVPKEIRKPIGISASRLNTPYATEMKEQGERIPGQKSLSNVADIMPVHATKLSENFNAM